MIISAIDPGSEQSAIVRWDGQQLLTAEIQRNEVVRDWLRTGHKQDEDLFVEMIASYGMAVGAEIFETCVWIGRFCEAWALSTKREPGRVKRLEVKMHHCQSPRATDSNIRRVLIDKYGPPGTKKKPGNTFGLAHDLWQAFALAAMITERKA